MINTYTVNIDGGHGELSLDDENYSAEGDVEYEHDYEGGFEVLSSALEIRLLTENSSVAIHEKSFEYLAIKSQVVAIVEVDVRLGG